MHCPISLRLRGSFCPPGQAGSDQAAAATVAPTEPQNVSKQTTRNYEIDRTISHTRLPAGRLKRLSVAVIVDNPTPAAAPAAAGDVADAAAGPAPAAAASPLSAEEVENLTRLVKDAVGFDQARGDSVNVMNAPFHQQAVEPVEPFDGSRSGSGR